MAGKELTLQSDQNTILSQYADVLEKNALIKNKENCKLCQSPFRAEAEMAYEETESFRAVYNFIKQKENITYQSVWRHLRNHYLPQRDDVLVAQYAVEIDKMMQLRRSRKQQINERIAILQRRMYRIEAATEGAELKEQRFTVKSLKDLSDTILAHERELESMEKGAEVVKMVIANLKLIMQEEIEDSENSDDNNNKGVKKALLRVWKKLADSLKEVEIDK